MDDIVVANTAFRKHHTIAACLSKTKHTPDAATIYAALRELAAEHPILEAYFKENEYINHYLTRSIEYRGDNLGRCIVFLAQDLSRSARGVLFADTKKELIAWVHNNVGMMHLSRSAAKELKWCHGIRPDAPVKLYRGLLFGRWQFSNSPRYVDHPKHAKTFLEALRHGHSSLSITYPNASSWTTMPEIAAKFARKKAATSQHAAMSNWINNSDKFIDKELGLIISAIVQPSDILCEVAKIDLGHLLHGNEGEFIISPDTNLTVDIEHIYLPSGEVSIDMLADFLEYSARLADDD